MKLIVIFVFRTINSIKLQAIHLYIIDIYVSVNEGVKINRESYRLDRSTSSTSKNFSYKKTPSLRKLFLVIIFNLNKTKARISYFFQLQLKFLIAIFRLRIETIPLGGYQRITNLKGGLCLCVLLIALNI